MKFGPIIYDPTSEEAKKLVGKTVIAADSYTTIADTRNNDTVKLVEICEDEFNPFRIEVNGHRYGYNFIREFIEEPPKYRPYKDTTEMVEDYKERFTDTIMTGSVEMPLIWLKNDSGSSVLVTAFCHEYIKNMDLLERLDEVFKHYAYLDGSPVGKEVNDD